MHISRSFKTTPKTSGRPQTALRLAGSELNVLLEEEEEDKEQESLLLA